MVEQMLSPVLVRRDDELSVLEDAFLSAVRGIAVGPAILAKGASTTTSRSAERPPTSPRDCRPLPAEARSC
jgi:hypothetical protein